MQIEHNEHGELVTVIIPVYNTSRFLPKCVDSVVNQTYSNLQIILVDDGSTDDSSMMCDQLAIKDQRIQVVHKENEGLGLTRNKGLDVSAGEFVTFIDSDDWISRDHIMTLLCKAKENNADIVIGTRTKCTTDDATEGLKLELPQYGCFEKKQISDVIIPDMIAPSDGARLDIGIPMSVCFNLYRRDIIKKNEIVFPSERYCVSEDFFFNYKYLLNCERAEVVKEYGYYYRVNPKSITHTFSPVQFQRVCNFYDEITKLVLSTPVTANIDVRVWRCCLAQVRGLLKRLSMTAISRNEKLQYIRMVINDSMVQNLLHRFDISKYRLSLRLFSYCMKYKLSILIYCLLEAKRK